jgi:transposase-like protein
VKKHQTTLSDEIERKIIRMFALCMSYKDISHKIKKLYAVSVSSATISAITDKGIPELKQWQQRSLPTIKSAKILSLYLSENEGANVWLSVLSDLQNRGMDDILIACVDGLTRFPEAINSIYPDTEVQLCVIHQIRNSIKYVASKHHKAFMADLKPVYRAVSK